MKVTGINGPLDLDEAVSAASAFYGHNLALLPNVTQSGRYWSFRIRAISSRDAGASVDPRTGRRKIAACWHAHRDVLAALFVDFPEATVRTTLENYHGAADFLVRYKATGYRNVGSLAAPASLSAACQCLGIGEGLLVRALRVVVDDALLPSA